jgi:trehalose synthase
MPRLSHIPVHAMDPRRFASVISAPEYEELLDLIDRGAAELAGRVIWNVNSTAQGGGVVELLRNLLGYSRGGGVDARWLVVSGGPSFFEVTKRIHNHLHGFDGGGGGLTESERAIYEGTLAENALELLPLLHPRDIVILHDPQTAALVDAVRSRGVAVIWRCHVGVDVANSCTRDAWDFLRPYVSGADAYVFSRGSYAWDGLDDRKVAVIHPSIDVFSPKNQDQTPEQTAAILSRAGILPHGATVPATFIRGDRTPGRVDRRADVLEDAPLTLTDRVVLQVSRWDRLKDPLGVMAGFAAHVAHRTHAHLVLAGPETGSVTDDPEGRAVLAEVRDAWHRLVPETRRRVHLVSLPMADIEENAAIVNALQRHAAVVVQKSVAEGFGLTVAEAMWKQQAVVASGIGGIQDQIVHGESGVLLPDPHDLEAFGAAVVDLLEDPVRAAAMGRAARRRVREEFLGPAHLRRHFELIQRVVGARASESLLRKNTYPEAEVSGMVSLRGADRFD